jgi:putative ABC transport system permease protein
MLLNYLLVALRSIRRQRGYAAINVFGLAAGLACCILIALFVRDELAYDRFHEHADRIVRVAGDFAAPGAEPDRTARASRPMAITLRERYPEVEAAVQLVPIEPTFRVGAERIRGLEGFYTEPVFFDIFTFPLAAGDPATALAEPFTAVLTESTARKLFGDADVLGQTFAIQDTVTMRVTGVARDVPRNSHLHFDFLLSYATRDVFIPPPAQAQWLQLDHFAYLLLRQGVDATAFGASVADLPQVEFGSVLEPYGFTMAMELEPLARIYLHSRRQAQIGPVSDGRTVTVFAAIALFVLLIACVNYMNLATARSLQRAREVGIRKTMGATRRPLAGQFLGESVMTVALALGVALVLVAAALPWFNEISGKALGFGALFSPLGLSLLLGLVVVVGLGAGSYPAAVLSRFHPVQVLKGDFRTSPAGARLRQGLVVVQFAVSVALIAGTLVVIEQHRFMRDRDLGFDRDRLVVLDARAVPTPERVRRAEAIREAMLAVPGVSHASASTTTPGRQLPLLLTVAEGLGEGDSRRMNFVFADHAYAETFGLRLAAGRYASIDFETDTAEAALLNESAVTALGWTPEEALGRWIQMGGNRRTVVGVVHDYHHRSLHTAVEPMVLMSMPPSHHQLTLRLEPGALPDALDGVRETWEELFPGTPFEYAFVDEIFDGQYQAEARLTAIVGTFAALAILIACLGLFGLAAYMTAQRRKEIGVRKVLGASAASVVILLSQRFAVLVALGFLLGAPLSYLALDRFLADFPYRITLGPALFIAAGALALLIALATVSGQALRAAHTDPVRALRSE